jgi:uncharacterized cupin superfamily protein
MKLTSVNADDQGDSYFGEVETADPPGSNKEREMEVAYWQVWVTQPGHYIDFKPTEEPRSLALMSGKVEVTASTGERRYFSRGDTFLIQDTKGKGHAMRTIGAEPCAIMLVTMKKPMTEFAA